MSALLFEPAFTPTVETERLARVLSVALHLALAETLVRCDSEGKGAVEQRDAAKAGFQRLAELLGTIYEDAGALVDDTLMCADENGVALLPELMPRPVVTQ